MQRLLLPLLASCSPEPLLEAGEATLDTADPLALAPAPFPGTPTAAVIELLPTSPYAWQLIRVHVLQPSVDPDGDPVQDTITWWVNNVVVASPGHRWLPRVYYRRGDWVQAGVQTTDGLTMSAWSRSAPVLVRNTPPLVTSPGVPTVPLAGAPIHLPVSCLDYDQDPTVAVYQWSLDGVIVAQGALTDTLPAGVTTAGASLVVEVSCDDGSDVGPIRRFGPVLVRP